MLRDNDSLADPRDMVKAHAKSTGHKPVLIGGYGSVSIVDPYKVRCIICMDGTYVTDGKGVTLCTCVERNLTGRRQRSPSSVNRRVESRARNRLSR